MMRLNALRRDTRGAALIEFALTAPVALLMAMGLCDLAYQLYMQSVLSGLVQKSGRDATIQGANTTTLDANVLTQMKSVNASVTYVTGSPSRQSYQQFGYISPEPFTDSNRNGVRDPGECFTDINGNGSWDANPGVSGNGGASDMVVYTAAMTYPHLFPMATWLGWPARATISATTILKNQPYTTQTVTTIATICT
jgi:Flp pilus assembly protein TadG